MIFTIRVTSGQERILSEILVKKARAERLGLYSIIHIDTVKGYLFVEASEENTVVKLIQKIKHIKGFLRTPITLEEIKRLITITKKPALTIEIGDMVEMISGPFKGERARVTQHDDAKDEITVELLEVAVPIPVTVKSKMVRLFQKKGATD